MQTVRVELGERSYDAIVASGLLASLGQRARTLMPDARRAFLAIDAGVPTRFADTARQSLTDAGLETASCSVTADERHKSIRVVESMLIAMGDAHLDRSDVLIALGGGLTGDVAGFAAATYKRGIAFIQCPTTLLSMVDASVGGKTGVNLVTASGLIKNMVGAFWQPRLVLADLQTLTTLTPRVFRAGWGEMLKHAMIAGASDPTLDDDTTNALTGDPADGPSLAALIARNIRLKSRIVSRDERETAPSSEGGRALLNLGHTFAHAMEPIPHLSSTDDPSDAPLEHGEAVALGLICAAATSHALGEYPKESVDRVRAGVERLGVRTRLDALPDDNSLIDAMTHDKKARSGRIRVIIPIESAHNSFAARMIDAPDPNAIRAGWSAIRG